MKFPAPAVRFVRPTARAPARSFRKNYFVKSLKSPLPLLLSLPLLLQSYYRGRAGRDHIMRGDRICELRLVSETFHWHIQRVASYPVGTVCRYTLRDQSQANSASWFMQFMQCAMYADKPSSSLETEQFRFRFEMAVDRTHSRAFICRRRRRRRRGRLNFGDPTKKVHAHKWPRAVENRKKHEFHAVHSCRSHTHFRESQGELRRGAELRDTIQGPDGCPLSSSGLIRIMWPRLLYQYLIMTFCRFTSGGLERNGRDHRDSCFAKNPPFLTRILPVLSPFHSSSILHYVNCSISMQI